jgi:hypothetical protein
VRALPLLLAFFATATAVANDSFILAPARGPEMMRQCSRPAPTQIEGFWAPDQKEISILETRLGALLGTAAGFEYLPLSQSHRQYVGFVRGGKRYIYGNFYPAFEGSGIDEGKEPVIICDGGRRVWGFVYSLESGQLLELEFNGNA